MRLTNCMRSLSLGRSAPALFAATLLTFAMHASAQDASPPTVTISKDNRSIAITATAEVVNEADVATVNIGYQLYGPDKDAAYASGSRASNAIIDALRAAGVSKESIESESQSVQPSQPFMLEKLTPAQQAAHAFVISQTWTVRVPADDAARVLDVAVRAGANQSGAIDWSLRDANAAQAAAAAQALQRARTQAAAMAGGLGVHLGSLLYASNQVAAEPVRPLMRAMAVNQSVVADKPLAINARSIHTSATVYAVFAIE